MLTKKNELLSNTLFQASQFLKYIFQARHQNGHGIHSPKAFEFVSEVLYDRKKYADYKSINSLLQSVLNDKQMLEVAELGGGSNKFNSSERIVSQLYKWSSVRPKYGRLLYRIARFYKPESVLEVGTSLGISSLYLSKGNPKAKIVTVEGNKSLSEYASKLTRNAGITNIDFQIGLFDEVLSGILAQHSFELAFIDGNHTYEATHNYFNLISTQMRSGIIILDDIHWSPGMLKAWKEIQELAQAVICIDLFFFGIVFMGEALTPKNYIVRF